MGRIQNAGAGRMEAETGSDAEGGGAHAMIHDTERVRATVNRAGIGLG